MVTGTIDQLTARERDCLRLVARGMSSKEIALTLGLSPLTVDGYLKEAARTLGVSSRREAARILAAHEHLSPQAPETPPPKFGGRAGGPCRNGAFRGSIASETVRSRTAFSGSVSEAGEANK
ncbi:MAG: helix-turn-helix transcriptional regulator [Sphingomonas sp.]|nr:helix-turn-helix transcriptional regulator [Sphingomonas sp.]